MSSDILSLVRGRSGHFLYESGYHADVWFDLETLCLHPALLQPYITQLADVVARYQPDLVCGPLVEGAYVALMVAQQLGCEFVYANRFQASAATPSPNHEARSAAATNLFSVEYRIPGALHPPVRGRRVVIVNDMISAGSAVRGAYSHLIDLGADVGGIACLMQCGSAFDSFAEQRNLPLACLTKFDSHLWSPSECPLCEKGIALESLANA